MKAIVFLLISFIMMLFMGTVYTWSVFRVEVETTYQLSTLQSGVPYMISLFFYALSMMITGRILTLNNTRKIAFIGFLLITLGWFLASQASTLLVLSISYGALLGFGVGMVYGVPVFMVQKQYQKSGLYTGIILAGFGASPLITAPLVYQLIDMLGLNETFLVMTFISAFLFIPLTLTLKTKNEALLIEVVQKSFSIKTYQILYGIFLIATTIGLMMIGLSYRIGVLNYGFNTTHIALSLSFFAVLNGLARPIFGFLMDKKGFIFSARLSASLIIIASIIALINQGNSIQLYIVSMGIFWFNLGAFLAMLPASIKHYFGTFNYAKRYGFMFTSYGLGAIVGTILSGILLDLFSATHYVYILILISTVIMFMLLAFLTRHISHYTKA